MDVWVAYSYSLYFFDQFSCIKFFDLSYGLKDIDFQSFNQFKSFLELFLLNKQDYPNSVVDWSRLTSGAPLSASQCNKSILI